MDVLPIFLLFLLTFLNYTLPNFVLVHIVALGIIFTILPLRLIYYISYAICLFVYLVSFSSKTLLEGMYKALPMYVGVGLIFIVWELK